MWFCGRGQTDSGSTAQESEREKLESARILLRTGRFDDAISRAYYAAFYAARALLLLLGVEARTHEGVLAMLCERDSSRRR